MNNLKILKKAHQIQIIAISSYIIVLIGSINIVIRLFSEDYINLIIISTFVGSLAFQIFAYLFFQRKWIKKGFQKTERPEELLRLLKNANLINKNYNLTDVEEKYQIKTKGTKNVRELDELPNKLIVVENKTFNTIFLIIGVVLFTLGVIWFINTKNAINFLMIFGALIIGIGTIKNLYFRGSIIEMSSNGIKIKGKIISWKNIGNWEINQVSIGSSAIKIIIYHSNLKDEVVISYANYAPFEIDYYIKKFIEKYNR